MSRLRNSLATFAFAASLALALPALAHAAEPCPAPEGAPVPVTTNVPTGAAGLSGADALDGADALAGADGPAGAERLAGAGLESAVVPKDAPSAEDERLGTDESLDAIVSSSIAGASGTAEMSGTSGEMGTAEGEGVPAACAGEKKSESSEVTGPTDNTPDATPTDAGPSTTTRAASKPAVAATVASGDKATSDKAAGDKAAGDKATSDKAAGDKATSDKATGGKATSDKATSDKATSDKAAGGKSTGGKAEPAAKRVPSAAEKDLSKVGADLDAAPQDSAGKGVALSTSNVAPPSDDECYAPDEVRDLYRLYNPYSGEHFYTENAGERDNLSSIGWDYEGVGWKTSTKRGTPVFRLYNPYAGDHHYTSSEGERDGLVGVGWVFEGVAWLSADFSRLPVWRVYNPNAQVGTHHYTLSKDEYDYLVSIGWNGEEVGFYGVDPDFVRERASTDFTRGVTSIKATVAAGDGSNAATVGSTLAHDTIYLFLPSYTNTHSVRLSAFGPSGKSLPLALSADFVNYRDVDVNAAVDLASFDASRSPEGGLFFRCKEGALATDFIHRLVVMVSANVSSVFVDSNDVAKAGRAYVEASKDHSAKAKVAVSVVSATGATVYGEDKLGTDDLSTIKGRGNMTWTNGSKKPYQISLNKKADLLQTGAKENKNKKWILLANMNDPSLLRNTVAYDLGLELGLTGMEGTPVDLYYDGEYRGSYYLCEKTEVKKGRVNIADLEDELEKANPDVDLSSLRTARTKNALGYEYQYVSGAKSPEDVTGGYLVELDKTYYVSQTCWFDTKIGHFSIKAPEACSKECMEYISVAFERALENYERSVFNSEDDFSFDLDSFVKSYFVASFLKNVDSYYSSTYFHIDRGSKTIYSGPIWDFDGSAGIRNEGPLEMSHVAYEGFNLWNAEFFAKSVPMRRRLTELYKSTIRPLIEGVLLGDESAVGDRGYLHSMSYYVNQVRESQRMNQVLFGLDGWDNILKAFSTYEENSAYLCNWLRWRNGWWARNIDTLVKDVSYPRPTYGGFDYSAVFDASYYLATCADARKYAPGGNARKALEHFVKYGLDKGLNASANFDVRAYRGRYADLQSEFGSDYRAYYKHYCTTGIFEGRVGWR